MKTAIPFGMVVFNVLLILAIVFHSITKIAMKEVLIEFSNSVSNEHKKRLEGYDFEFFEKSNLDGDAATWIAITSLSIQAIPSLFKLVTDMMSLNKVTKIKVGELEVENPNKEMIQLLLEKMKETPKEIKGSKNE